MQKNDFKNFQTIMQKNDLKNFQTIRISSIAFFVLNIPDTFNGTFQSMPL